MRMIFRNINWVAIAKVNLRGNWGLGDTESRKNRQENNIIVQA